MDKSNFEKALEIVLGHEGGYSNIPEDHGGPTKYGITQHDLSIHRGHSVSADDVSAMSVKEAGEIYLKTYWKPYHLDEVKSFKIAAILFDQGVLCGPGTAIRLMQQALKIQSDGKIGPQTLAALNSCDEKSAGLSFLDRCDERFEGIVNRSPDQSLFLNGWLNRTHDLRRILNG